MNLFGWEIQRKTATTISIDQVIRNFEAIFQTTSAESITPENCMRSPTVHAIVMGIAKAVSSLSIDVLQQTYSNDRTTNEKLPNHPVANLLDQPNKYQTNVDYWQDAVSAYIRYGRYYAYKGRGTTGPIRQLNPLIPASVSPRQDDNYNVTYQVTSANGMQRTYTRDQLHVARSAARDFVCGESWILDCRESIALEIAAEKFGASFFGGGAMPGVIFKLMEGFQAFKKEEEKVAFLQQFQQKFSGKGRFTAAMLPKGVEIDKEIPVDNDKAQFLETRKYQRTVIAGAAGVPPYMVGDLERQTFNNAEQQNINKLVEVILPVVRVFETAMERDLLTTEDRNKGIIIRFNLDAALRGDFLQRQTGLNIQRQAGVINANDWRQLEKMNPISAKDGGEEYWRQGPSGQNANPGSPSKPPQQSQTPPAADQPANGGSKSYAFTHTNGH